jgi:uncharacterized delta-60 repeat protein
MSFQAVIRDASGELVANQSVGLRMSILQGSVSGSSVYTETHSPTTNSSGLISIEIGGGTTSDDFSSIDWSNGPYYLKREVDPAGGTNYTISGTSEFLSVPYAMYATIADTILNAPDTSSTNEIQNLSVSPSGDTLYISGGNNVIVPGITAANTNALTFNKTYGGSDDDYANSIQQTSDGGYIIVGSTRSSDGDISDGNNGNSDFWILKLNSDGTKVWDKTYGGSANDRAISIQQTSDGGYLVAGYTNSSDGDITDGNNGSDDFWILKLNSDGTKVWDKTYGGSANDQAYSIQLTSDGGFIVAGYTNSSDDDITDGNNGYSDFWILKLNSDGTKVWDKTYGGSGSDRALSIQLTSDGGFIIAGSTGAPGGDVTEAFGGGDFWILKLNSAGIKEWDKTYGGSLIDIANSIQLTSDGGYLVAGYTYSSDGNSTDGNNGKNDIWILKLNSDGTKVWDKTYGGSDDDFANSIQLTSDGGYLVAGYTSSSNWYMTGGNNGAYDFWILILNNDGTKDWDKPDKLYGGSSFDVANSMQLTSDGGFIIAGYTTSSDGDITDGNNGMNDIWILKLNKDGYVSY